MSQCLAKQVTLRYKPHPGQLRFHMCMEEDPAIRFRAVAPGRRWGKTFCGANEVIRHLGDTPPGSIGYIIAPSYNASSLGKCWRTLQYFAPKELVREWHATPGNRFVRWVGDRLTYFRSAEAPESCKGDSVHYAWFDEPAEMNEEIWDVSVLPSLMDCDGIAWFTGTPKGSNWYKFLFMKGQNRTDFPEYWSYGGSSYDNTLENGGFLKKASIDVIAANMSENSRQQEIMGVFIDDVGRVFRRVEDCISGEFEDPRPDKRYVIGSDVARYQDYTFNIVLDEDGHMVAGDRFNEVEWKLQARRTYELAKRYNNARILIDSTASGDPVYEELKRHGALVQGYKFKSNQHKADLIENLAIRLENMDITYPAKGRSIEENRVIEALLHELRIYGYMMTENGVKTYNAPDGYHDDGCIALALAAWLIKRAQTISASTGTRTW